MKKLILTCVSLVCGYIGLIVLSSCGKPQDQNSGSNTPASKCGTATLEADNIIASSCRRDDTGGPLVTILNTDIKTTIDLTLAAGDTPTNPAFTILFECVELDGTTTPVSNSTALSSVTDFVQQGAIFVTTGTFTYTPAGEVTIPLDCPSIRSSVVWSYNVDNEECSHRVPPVGNFFDETCAPL